ncbi:MAG: iron(III) transport system substrate-binding protein [Alteromonadaceae bacterium]|jgi:iron(III) transport system substrate-binding protein
MKKILLSAMLLLTSGLVSQTAVAATDDVVNIYSYRQPFLIDPILASFTQQTGIKTKVVFAKKGLLERLKREGKFSPADVVLTADFNLLLQLTDAELTQSFSSKVIDENVPSAFMDPLHQWIALTKRVRNIYSSKERMGDLNQVSYEDLASAQYKGKLCTRSGKHPYNIALVSSMIAHHGQAQTKQWLLKVKANLARKPQGNDRAQVKAIKEGLCDLALGNSYYYGKMLQDEKQKVWAEAVNINFPNQKNRGSHINVSGIVMAKHAPHKVDALKLINYLTSAEAQQLYASLNMEYPVKVGVKLDPLVASWGEFKEDSVAIAEVAGFRKQALALLDETRFDLN